MNLRPGLRLGAYEIRGLVGAGGMGEVYRAWDARLGREVAVKILPDSVATNPERLRRFDHEARATGALNHPNVLAVYDVGSHESSPYIVSELLEGETLGAYLRAGTLPVRKAVEHAIQIARGLAAAHQKGIIHRDLKPQNIFITRDGQVKILDFGLAKLTDEAGSDRDGETVTRQTRAGAVLGTVGYMSPEQVLGVETDARSDIFALGAILYEMLVRRRAFTGDTTVEIQTAILQEEPPDLHVIDTRIPISLNRIVRRCLEKRAQDRFETARDVAFALEAVEATGTPSAALEVAGRPLWGRALAVPASLLAAAVLGALLFAALRRPAPPPSYTRLTFRHGAVLSARFSQDGQTVVYSAAWNGQPAQVFASPIGSAEARPLGVEGIVLSVSSKDEVAVKLGRFLARQEHGKDDSGTLARFPLAGGAPRELLENVTAADWDPEGRDLAVVHENRLEYPIGHVVYQPQDLMFYVRIVPGGRFAVVEWSPGVTLEPLPFVLSLVDRAGRRTVLSPGWGSFRDVTWSQATRELFFAGDGIRSVSLTGREHVIGRMPGDFVLHDVDPRGRLLLASQARHWSVVCLPPGESRERDVAWLNGSEAVDLSADGRQILLMEWGGPGDTQTLYLRKTDGSPGVRLGEELGIALSPDGRWVLALPGSVGSADHFVLVPTGAGARRELRHGSIPNVFAGAWFPDGRRIAVLGGEHGRVRLSVWDIEMSAPPRPLTTAGDFGAPVVSPDGRSVVVTAAGARLMLYPVEGGPARSVPGGAAGDRPLRWSDDGRWLYVRRGNRAPGGDTSAWIDRIEMATVTRQPWRELKPSDLAGVHGIRSVLITPDGKSYAYGFGSSIGSLYLAEGLR